MSELVKEALSPATVGALSNAVKGFGSGAGMGSVVGGAAGAALGGIQGYRHQRQAGASVGQSALGGLGSAVHGAAGGLAAGALAGGVAGAARPALAASLGREGSLLHGASNFGQRQVHAFTGVGDAKYVRSIGGGAADAHEALQEARGAIRGAADPEARRAAVGKALDARKAYQASNKAEQMGLTSLPGYAKALYHDPKAALKAGFNDQWQGQGAGGKALMYGLPAAFAGKELLSKGEQGGEGPGRFERTGRSLGESAGFVAAPIPIAGQFGLGSIAGGAAGRLGRGVDHLLARRGRSPGQPALAHDSTAGAAQAADHELSDRAAGTIEVSQ